MQIENDLIVKIGDGEVIFEEPMLDDWTVMVELEGKSLKEQSAILLPKVLEVRGFKYKDGTDVTVESLKTKPLATRFFLQLIKGWTKAITDALRGEAEAGNG